MFVPLNNDYIIVKLLANDPPLSEIYSFVNQQWTIGPPIDCISHLNPIQQIRSSSFVVSTHDHIYWTVGLFVCSFILAFDTSASIFYRIDPPFIPPLDLGFMDSITVLDGKLSYVTWIDHLVMNIWVDFVLDW